MSTNNTIINMLEYKPLFKEIFKNKQCNPYKIKILEKEYNQDRDSFVKANIYSYNDILLHENIELFVNNRPLIDGDNFYSDFYFARQLLNDIIVNLSNELDISSSLNKKTKILENLTNDIKNINNVNYDILRVNYDILRVNYGVEDLSWSDINLIKYNILDEITNKYSTTWVDDFTTQLLYNEIITPNLKNKITYYGSYIMDDTYGVFYEDFEIIHNTPNLFIFKEKVDGSLEEVVNIIDNNEAILKSMLFQITILLTLFSIKINFIHYDLDARAILFKNTNEEYLYFKLNNKIFKIPTFGKIWILNDFEEVSYILNDMIIQNNEDDSNYHILMNKIKNIKMNNKDINMNVNNVYLSCARLCNTLYTDLNDDFASIDKNINFYKSGINDTLDNIDDDKLTEWLNSEKPDLLELEYFQEYETTIENIDANELADLDSYDFSLSNFDK
jgi:hypothetical protein